MQKNIHTCHVNRIAKWRLPKDPPPWYILPSRLWSSDISADFFPSLIFFFLYFGFGDWHRTDVDTDSDVDTCYVAPMVHTLFLANHRLSLHSTHQLFTCSTYKSTSSSITLIQLAPVLVLLLLHIFQNLFHCCFEALIFRVLMQLF